MQRAEFTAALAERRECVYAYLQSAVDRISLRSRHLGEAVASYVRQPGKGLRSCILLLSCSAMEGEEERAIPAAAAVELFHVWTLVHDDIIDRDDLRRGKPTVHAALAKRAQSDLGVTGEAAAHYGLTQALLAGDLQQGWSATLLTDAATQRGVSAHLVLHLIADLFGNVETQLVDGESLDVQFSLEELANVTEAETLDMIQKKTGALYAFAATAGACIGLDAWQPENAYVTALASFGRNCGIAFQLQDDVLGVIGDEAVTGKPVGSDVREGKRTPIVWETLRNATATQRGEILQTLGNRAASEAQVARVSVLLQELGGVAYARSLAQSHIAEAHACLARLPDSPSRNLLHALAGYVLERDS